MAKFIDKEIIPAFLASDCALWVREFTPPPIVQSALYKLDAIVSGELYTFQIVIVPKPFATNDSEFQVVFSYGISAGLWVEHGRMDFIVELDGRGTDFRGLRWKRTDNEILDKIAKISAAARPSAHGSRAVN